MRFDPCCCCISCSNFTNFYQKHSLFGLCCICQYFQQTVIRGQYNLTHFVNQRNLSRFHLAYNFLLHQRLFNHGQYGLIHIVLSKKTIKLHLNCVVLFKTFIQKLYVLNHIILSSILYKFPRKALFFSLFSSKAVFFSLFTPF